jgi:pyruvate/2-oxoglutarate dehydrogenase complex dihydrolipoamide acyltransferase (E2) component
MDQGKYKKRKYPKSRIATFDVGKISLAKHHIAGLLEIDLTEARKIIKQRIKAREEISLISWFIKSTGTVLKEFPEVHGLLNKKSELIVFEDIDVAVPIERKVNGKKVPLVMLIKDVNKKSAADIYTEMHEAKGQNVYDEGDYVLGERRQKFTMKLFYFLPQRIRLFIWNRLLRNPLKIKNSMGTVIITVIGLLSSFPGWILPKSMHNLCLGLGTITKKPWVVKNKIKIREILNLTVLFNHDVVDGAPASRFIKKLVYFIENAKGF